LPKEAAKIVVCAGEKWDKSAFFCISLAQAKRKPIRGWGRLADERESGVARWEVGGCTWEGGGKEDVGVRGGEAIEEINRHGTAATVTWGKSQEPGWEGKKGVGGERRLCLSY